VTVVTTSRQTESEQIRTRIVRNHNINHAMTVQYYQVLSHYRVVTDVHEESDVLLVPYEIDEDLFDTIPSFEKFRQAPPRRITRFLLRHRRLLEQLVPAEYRPAFESLSRLVHCRDVYKIETPRATASRWEIRIDQSIRSGVSLSIETDDGQSVPLTSEGSKTSSRFRSDPIDLSAIEGLRVSFDASEAAREAGSFPVGGLFSLVGQAAEDFFKNVVEYRLTNVEVRARTDRSRFVPTPRNFRLPAESVNVTLSAGNPATVVSLSTPDLDEIFSEWFGREHQDYCRLQQLIDHVQQQSMLYFRAIWLTEDPDRRALRFDRFTFDGQPLLDQIQNRPIGVFGNYVAFPMLDGHRLIPTTSPKLEVSQRVVSLPTRGVFAEVYLSCCNATEVRDVTRIIDKETGCNLSAPDITGITPGSRRAEVATTPTPFPPSLVSIQTPPTLPDPTGLASALQLLATPNIFRDMSNAQALVQFIQAATGKAFENVTEGQKAQMELVKALLPSVLGALTGGAGALLPGLAGAGSAASSLLPSLLGGSAGAGAAGAAGAAGSISGGAGAVAPLIAAAAGDALRKSSPGKVFDMQSLIRQAVAKGDIPSEAGTQAMTALLGGTPGGGGVVNAAFFPSGGSATLQEPAGRPCCVLRPNVFGLANIVDLGDLTNHVYGGAYPFREKSGLIYTCRGGFVDLGHARDLADLTGYIASKAVGLLGSGGTLALRPEGTGLTRVIRFHALNQTPDPELCVLLAQRIAYEISIWHEIVTWFPGVVPQRVSSFSPEDNFSNLLGTYIGADALRSSADFQTAALSAIHTRLTALKPMARADTQAAFDAVKNKWWKDTPSPVADDAVLRRHFDALGNVTPWLIAGLAPCAGEGAVTLPVPDKDPNGQALDAYYALELGVNANVPSGAAQAVTAAGAGGPATPADFGALIGFVRNEAKAVFGANADKP